MTEVSPSAGVFYVKTGTHTLKQKVGLTIAEVKVKLSGIVSIPQGAVAYIDGRSISDDTRPGAEDVVMFSHKTGEKG